MINVTKTYLPPFDEYIQVLRKPWEKSHITNNGELVQQLEKELAVFLGVRNLLFCANGTVVLQMALKALNITGEVITTPFSYVATTNVILWENATPVFVDIEPLTFCIDADKIEEAITPKTQAILATHVYGYPCNIEKIRSIAERYKLKVIYDAAHSFGAQWRNRQLLSYGDISTCSFHATKVFHTVEGGCIISDNDELFEKIKLFRSFGHVADDYFTIGINGKNSEFHAAMGICNLRHIDEILKGRRDVSACYGYYLSELPLQRPAIPEGLLQNHSYYPVFFESETVLKKVMAELKDQQINTRRYFYPSLNKLPYLANTNSCPIAEDIAARVLCLPLYYGLEENDVKTICGIIRRCVAKVKALV